MRRVLLLAIVLILIPASADAAPSALAPVFTDSMVLQRDVPVPVWGTADAGTPITVSFSAQRKQTNADDNGKWSVTLDAMKADAEPRELKVVAGDSTLIVRAVLVGEVWVAAGQSNMEWPLEKRRTRRPSCRPPTTQSSDSST